MTKKTFIDLADTIRIHNNFNSIDPFTANQIKAIADFCASQNSAFNRERWMEYVCGNCGKNGGKVK